MTEEGAVETVEVDDILRDPSLKPTLMIESDMTESIELRVPKSSAIRGSRMSYSPE